jgi:hypothetical protein
MEADTTKQTDISKVAPTQRFVSFIIPSYQDLEKTFAPFFRLLLAEAGPVPGVVPVST